MNTITLVLSFAAISQNLNLPPGLINAVCYTESRYDINAIHYHDGRGNSVGVCQIKHSTARQFGFKGSEKDLIDYNTNIFFAAKYLRHQLVRYHNDVRRAVGAYNSGSYRKGVNPCYIHQVVQNWKN